VGLGVGEVGALGFEELLGDVFAERLGDDLIVFQRIKSLPETAGQGRNAEFVALGLVELIDVLADGFARVSVVLDTVESSLDDHR